MKAPLGISVTSARAETTTQGSRPFVLPRSPAGRRSQVASAGDEQLTGYLGHSEGVSVGTGSFAPFAGLTLLS